MSTPSKVIAARWRVLGRTKSNLIEHLCELRGLTPNNLEPDFSTQLHDPLLLPDMKIAVDLVKDAVAKKWPVVIFGDYDADGTPAAALLSMVMDRLGVRHQVILPTRTEGYGLSLDVVENLPAETKLLITVDTGITNIDEITLAKKKGLKVIVLDHHLPKSKGDGGLPPADAVVDPFVPGSAYPFPYLCGCALAYKLTEALSVHFPAALNESFKKWLLDLVAISTVADMMPITGENRVLVHYGLKVLKKTRRPGLQALLTAAGIAAEKVTAGTLGFTIGPRLNASGRLHDNRPAFELLVTRDPDQAAGLAEVIEANNRERQALVEKVMADAEEQLFRQNSISDRCLVVVGRDWPAGVLGLVAGKFANKHLRPTIVLSEHGGQLSGSSRSSGDYSIIEGLDSQQALLSRYGGHRQAAGLGLAKGNLSKFVDGIKAHATERISAADLVPSYIADGFLETTEASLDTAELISKMGPFGQENATPLLIWRGVTLGPPRLIGASGDHCKWSIAGGGGNIDVIGFGMGNRETFSGPVDLLGHLEVNEWRESVKPQLRLVDFRPAGMEIEETNAKA